MAFPKQVLATAGFWLACALISLGAYELWRGGLGTAQDRAFVVAVVALIAGASTIGPRIGALVLLALGLLLALRFPIGWLLMILPSDLRPMNAAVVAPMTVLITGVLMAIRRRPPGRNVDGSPVLASRLINWIALVCVAGGPVLGWVAFERFAPGDIYLRPFVAGLAIGLYGLFLLIGYAAFYVLVRRPGTAAILAAVFPLLLLFALSAPDRSALPQPTPEAIVGYRLADGRLVRASRAGTGTPPELAFDGRADTAWGAGTFAPGWIEIHLAESATIGAVRLLVAQTPGGETAHQVTGSSGSGGTRTLGELRGFTHDGDWLTLSLTPPAEDVTSIRITTVTSPSWVAWGEIELVLVAP